MKEDLENFYLGFGEPQRSTLLALRDVILEHDENITSTQKYGMPCFLYKKNIVCYLWTDKKSGEPYILMAEGKHLKNPHLETGTRSRMKILRIDPDKDLPIHIIESLLNEAINLYNTGVVKFK